MSNTKYTPSVEELATAWARVQVDRERAHGRIATDDDYAGFISEAERVFGVVAAQAWDEGAIAGAGFGYSWGQGNAMDHSPFRANPYRTEESN